ncbi:FKBP-type peptidyl-prolyl cis-trans isomerase [Candidatus Woesearchaeota archaeon]|nr:FKBP-type peptidyl-prolyl cis-trans isomerase [Candidatus Woesearchaeota archaeon]
MTIKKGDFIEINYTASLVDDGSIFDTTIPDDAEKAGMICEHDHDHGHNHGHTHVTRDDFKSLKICVGENHVLPGLDEQLIGLNVGEHDIILGEENAFGKKDSKLLKLMPLNVFKKQKVNPFPGLTVDLDGSRGVVRSVSGGRVIVDFNHPLSGKTVKYSISILRKIDDVKEKVESVLSLIRLPYDELVVNNDEVKVKVSMDLPEDVLKNLKSEVEKVTKTSVVFETKKKVDKVSEKKVEDNASDE